MKIISETSLTDFSAWSGTKDTKQTILDNNKESEFDSLIEELYPDGLTVTQLNDILWFESGWIYESLGISEDKDGEDE